MDLRHYRTNPQDHKPAQFHHPFGRIGGRIDSWARLLRVVFDRDRCTHCGRCDVECPVDIPGIPENIRSTECIRCLECLETCAVRDAVTLQLG